MELVITAYIFAIGAAMGSFAGAVAWRLEKGKDFVRERSECEHCHHKLSWLDLVPILSWLWLRGRCRYCRKPIGWTPIVLELTLGAVFALSYIFWPYDLTNAVAITMLVAWLVSCVMLAILFVYDLRWFLLPDKVVWPLVAVGLVLFVSRALLEGWGVGQTFLEALASVLPITGVYYTLYSISKGKWIGFGDVKLGLFIGLALGWQGALVVLVLANLIGTLWIVPGMFLGKLKRHSQVPFGPFLIVATLITMLWQSHLVSWYMEFLHL